jgi:hypothetical protein
VEDADGQSLGAASPLDALANVSRRRRKPQPPEASPPQPHRQGQLGRTGLPPIPRPDRGGQLMVLQHFGLKHYPPGQGACRAIGRWHPCPAQRALYLAAGKSRRGVTNRRGRRSRSPICEYGVAGRRTRQSFCMIMIHRERKWGRSFYGKYLHRPGRYPLRGIPMECQRNIDLLNDNSEKSRTRWEHALTARVIYDTFSYD